MSTSMLDISEVNSPVSTSNNFKVAPMRTSTNLTSRALSKMSCRSEVPSPLFYTMDLTMSSISSIHTPTSNCCSEALSLKTLYSLFGSLDINKPNNSLPDLFKPASKGHTYKDPRLSSLMPHTKVDLYKSPSQLVLPLTNSLALPKLRTITMMSLLSVDPASKWHKMESIIMMPPLLSAAATLYAIYKTVPASKFPSELCEPRIISSFSPEDILAKVGHASKWHKFEFIIMMPPLLSAAAMPYALYKTVPASKWPEICLAKPRSNYKVIPASKLNKIFLVQPRSISKTTPAYKESRSRASCQRYKVTQSSKWYEVQTLSKVDVIKFSSSLCLMDPRLQYLTYMKSHPREGITRHSATSGQLPACRP